MYKATLCVGFLGSFTPVSGPRRVYSGWEEGYLSAHQALSSPTSGLKVLFPLDSSCSLEGTRRVHREAGWEVHLQRWEGGGYIRVYIPTRVPGRHTRLYPPGYREAYQAIPTMVYSRVHIYPPWYTAGCTYTTGLGRHVAYIPTRVREA